MFDILARKIAERQPEGSTFADDLKAAVKGRNKRLVAEKFRLRLMEAALAFATDRDRQPIRSLISGEAIDPEEIRLAIVEYEMAAAPMTDRAWQASDAAGAFAAYANEWNEEALKIVDNALGAWVRMHEVGAGKPAADAWAEMAALFVETAGAG